MCCQLQGPLSKSTARNNRRSSANDARVGAKGVPYVATHDGRTIRYPDPNSKMHDVIKLATGAASLGSARMRARPMDDGAPL